MYYFGYCTWLNPPELKRFMPEAKPITIAEAANHRLLFHAAGDRKDRGWCHFSSVAPDAWGTNALGVVFEHNADLFDEDFDDFERCAVTVKGRDGKTYDCWTYRLSSPGIAMRPPNFYWQHIPDGMKHWEFPADYIQSVLDTYNAASECPRADRPNPSAIPGKSADTR
ncbi:gamma-glutamyl cyclotransferase [Devosia sp. H5989]|nr:gamma-glutamyl cyclotransferase [Devosia sp. H5989]